MTEAATTTPSRAPITDPPVHRTTPELGVPGLRPRPSRTTLGLVLAVALGGVIRAAHTLSSDFPLNDGGMFYGMVQDLQRAGYRLPEVASYNFLDLPYGYSPFGFYLAGLLADFTPLSLTDVFRFLPLAVTVATVAAFALLARALLRSGAAAVAATLAFAVVPRSFIWPLMGGGLTRSLGFLFAVLALHQVHALYVRRRLGHLAAATVFSALTLVSHLGTAPFLVVAIVLFFLWYGRHRHGLLSSIALALGTAALSAPWWGTVIARHGLEPFLAAGATGDSFFSDTATRWRVLAMVANFGVRHTGEPLFPLVGVLAVLGGLMTLRSHYILFPIWWIATLVIDARQGTTLATIPIALLAGIGTTEVLAPLARRAAAGSELRARALLAVCLAYAAIGAMATDPRYSGEARVLVALSAAERAAMRWMAEATPAESRVAIVTASPWQADRVSEWFPVLANRRSVATVQGYEWAPVGAFARQEQRYRQLQGCARSVAGCIDEWIAETGQAVTHVYIPDPLIPGADCCVSLMSSLLRDPDYELVYGGPGATIFARRAGVDPDSAT